MRSVYFVVDIKKIREIRVGYQSPIWEQLGPKTPEQDRCFSLVSWFLRDVSVQPLSRDLLDFTTLFAMIHKFERLISYVFPQR